MSCSWYRGGPSLLFGIEISFFGIEILHSVVQHLDRLLPGINPCVSFGASTSCSGDRENLDTKKNIEKSRCPKKDISIPTKRVTPFLRLRPQEGRQNNTQVSSASHKIAIAEKSLRFQIAKCKIAGLLKKSQKNGEQLTGNHSDFSGVRKRVVFKKGGFAGCSPGARVHSDDVPPERNWDEGTFACSPGTRNQNEGTFAKTTLLRNRPFVSSRIFGIAEFSKS